MTTVGITGSLSTGKTTVARMLSKKGAVVVDADKIARKLIAPNGACVKSVKRVFGKNILTKGTVDRKKLATIVFSDKKALEKLCSIIHPKVKNEIKRNIAKYEKKRVVVIDAPLLIESGLDNLVDVLIVVRSNAQKQISRAKKHLGLSVSEAKKRINAQMPINEKIKYADVVIDNRRCKGSLSREVDKVWKKIKRLNKTKNKDSER